MPTFKLRYSLSDELLVPKKQADDSSMLQLEPVTSTITDQTTVSDTTSDAGSVKSENGNKNQRVSPSWLLPPLSFQNDSPLLLPPFDMEDDELQFPEQPIRHSPQPEPSPSPKATTGTSSAIRGMQFLAPLTPLSPMVCTEGEFTVSIDSEIHTVQPTPTLYTTENINRSFPDSPGVSTDTARDGEDAASCAAVSEPAPQSAHLASSPESNIDFLNSDLRLILAIGHDFVSTLDPESMEDVEYAAEDGDNLHEDFVSVDVQQETWVEEPSYTSLTTGVQQEASVEEPSYTSLATAVEQEASASFYEKMESVFNSPTWKHGGISIGATERPGAPEQGFGLGLLTDGAPLQIGDTRSYHETIEPPPRAPLHTLNKEQLLELQNMDTPVLEVDSFEPLMDELPESVVPASSSPHVRSQSEPDPPKPYPWEIITANLDQIKDSVAKWVVLTPEEKDPEPIFSRPMSLPASPATSSTRNNNGEWNFSPLPVYSPPLRHSRPPPQSVPTPQPQPMDQAYSRSPSPPPVPSKSPLTEPEMAIRYYGDFAVDDLYDLEPPTAAIPVPPRKSSRLHHHHTSKSIGTQQLPAGLSPKPRYRQFRHRFFSR